MILDAVFEESEELNANFGVVMNVGDGKDYVLTDEDKAEIAGMVDAVSYSQSQNLTDEQKKTARENIGVNTTVSITDDGYGNIALNIEGAGMDVTFTDDGNGNIKMEVM